MAEKAALKKVKDQLNCSICLDVYTDPKCLHVFCQTCLVRLVFRDDQGHLVLSCPNCRHITPVPASGVAGLQPAFHIIPLLEIAEDFAKEKEVPDNVEEADSGPPPLQEKVSKVATFCSEHAKEELKLFCETCGELICLHCALKTGKHHNHNYALIEEAFEMYKKEISALLEPISKKLTSVNEVLAQYYKNNGELSDQRAAIEADIHASIDGLHQVLDARRTELISRLHQLTQRKRKDLAAERDQAETIHAQLSGCQNLMKQSLKTDRWGEALKAKTTVLKQVKELTSTVQPDALKPSIKADIEFATSADITTLCRHFGKVSTPGSPDPSKCHATGKGLEAGIVGQTSTVILQACNSKGEPCTQSVTSLECKLVSDLTGTETTGSFKKLARNHYEISYQPTIKGRHQLHISIQGKPVMGSPFRPAVTSSIANLGAPMHTIAGVRSPWGIAINHKGEIVVSERHTGHISTYTPSGKKIQTIDMKGLKPFGLTLDREGNIIVGEDSNYSVKKYSPEGQLLASIGTEGSGRRQFQQPSDVAFNTKNNKIYVADWGNHRIQVLNSNFNFSTSFGKEGKENGQFNYPQAVACDSAGHVYVADSANCRIQVFTAEGKFLRKFGARDECGGELRPIGIALDPTSGKHVYVSETVNHCVSVFTCEGQFVTSFGADVKKFDPRGLAVDNSGIVYVSDFSTSSGIQIF